MSLTDCSRVGGGGLVMGLFWWEGLESGGGGVGTYG